MATQRAEGLLVKDKWDEYLLQNERGVEYAALDLVIRRVEDGLWYDNWDEAELRYFPRKTFADIRWEDRAKKIVADGDADAALAFLLERSDFEYEYVEVQ